MMYLNSMQYWYSVDTLYYNIMYIFYVATVRYAVHRYLVAINNTVLIVAIFYADIMGYRTLSNWLDFLSLKIFNTPQRRVHGMFRRCPYILLTKVRTY